MNRTEKGLCRLGCGTGPNNRGGERRGVHRKARMLDICTAVSEGAVQEPCRSRKRSRSRAGADAAHVPPDSSVSLAGRVGGGQSLMAFEPYPRRRGLLTEACARLFAEVSAAAQKKLRTRCLGPGVFRSAGASCAPVALSLFFLGGCRAHDDLHQVAVIEHLAGHGLYVGVG